MCHPPQHAPREGVTMTVQMLQEEVRMEGCWQCRRMMEKTDNHRNDLLLQEMLAVERDMKRAEERARAKEVEEMLPDDDMEGEAEFVEDQI
ncbi:uncharacterized protein H6S33_007940 [Morchella sextelata]|uniref:uncharacterized protein n=1 Tax=Morchella sextelata TaxID=1174677 RepID=UPI001D0515D5|nr:uncharacterized protein H6S33_007940 [Morchella sextelata]KAH0602936.1 hypothetical protein H6S33_007940 [Morchella sextelata]